MACPRGAGVLLISGLTGVAVACALPYEMQRAGPAGSPCPEVSEPPAENAPPDTTELRWYRSASGRDQELGGEWCATVGAPVFLGRPTGSFSEWRVGDSLVVLSWNMHVGGGDVHELLDVELGLDCSAQRPAQRPGFPPFLLLLQNAYRTSESLPAVASGTNVPRAIDPDVRSLEDLDIVTVAGRCGLALHYVASARNGPDSGPRPREDKGNAILSTLPLTTPIAIDLPIEGARKVAVAATVVLPGDERLRVVSADIEGLSTLVRTLVSGNQTRTRQVSGLIDALERAQDDGPLTGAALVGGDFSSWDDAETALLLMREAFGESPAWDGRSTRGPFSTDHIFFRRGSFVTITVGHYERLENAYGSNHFGRRVAVNYLPRRGSG